MQEAAAREVESQPSARYCLSPLEKGATMRAVMTCGIAAALTLAGTAVGVNFGTTASTLGMNAVLVLTHGAENPSSDPSSDCAQADECAARRIFGQFPGLGQVDARHDIAVDAGEPACGAAEARLLAYAVRLMVAGKGEIHVAVGPSSCVPGADIVNASQTFTVTGGVGS